MARRKDDFKAVVYLDMPPLSASVLEPLARQWTAGNREGLPSAQRQWRGRDLDPKVPMWPLPADSWRVLPGGITFRLPGLSQRGIALIRDPARARSLWTMEEAGVRRACYLMKSVDGDWLLSARFKYKEGLVERKTRRGYATWVQKHGKARWFRAPAGWPRDKYGRPMSSRAIVAAVGRGELPEDSPGLPARTLARLAKQRATGDSDRRGHSEHPGGTD